MIRLETLFQQFLQERTYLKNITPKTRVWYQSAWKAFKGTQTNTPERLASAALIERADLNRFVVRLRERGVKPVSCNTWLRAMNAFCRWLHEEGELATLVKVAFHERIH
jgi:site-specific recombinase XerD